MLQIALRLRCWLFWISKLGFKYLLVLLIPLDGSWNHRILGPLSHTCAPTHHLSRSPDPLCPNQLNPSPFPRHPLSAFRPQIPTLLIPHKNMPILSYLIVLFLNQVGCFFDLSASISFWRGIVLCNLRGPF